MARPLILFAALLVAEQENVQTGIVTRVFLVDHFMLSNRCTASRNRAITRLRAM